jgi:hypothetical protein
LNANKLIVGTSALAMANVALAGDPVPLGNALGVTLGDVLGAVLGLPLGSALPSLLTVAAMSLVVGICIVRRKRNH